MNVNLFGHLPDLRGHAEIMRRNYDIVGPPILVPDEDITGVFQVWWACQKDQTFIHVSPDGLVIRTDAILPEHFIAADQPFD